MSSTQITETRKKALVSKTKLRAEQLINIKYLVPIHLNSITTHVITYFEV
jgi:hypothetical protein